MLVVPELVVAPHRTTVVTGPGGSGKSLLMSILAQVPPSGVEVRGTVEHSPVPVWVGQGSAREPGHHARVAAALARPCCLLDEPEVGIAADGPTYVVDLVRRAQARHATVVLATHHLGLLRAVADDLVVMLDGTILAAGPAAEILAAPPSQRVADFLTLGS